MKCGKRMKAGGPTSMDMKKMGRNLARAANQGMKKMKTGGVVRGMGAATKGAGKGPWG